MLCFVVAKLAMTKPCHTELSQESEVSIKSKCEFTHYKAWIFYLKFEVCLKFCGYFANAQYDNMDFSLVLLAQNDKNEFLP